ncbi:hypothetical protein DSM104299_03109 [Baekduia alba]|uniref:hypothetical protein n=1 Tax=Baekduia alba TaxID=2997333 RepID=UPI00233FDE7C|nr:hypothetical protein [Baekduia alba]WCB94375.1 hypothetical protein DSM104299_03109 [Baekduia alba]
MISGAALHGGQELHADALGGAGYRYAGTPLGHVSLASPTAAPPAREDPKTSVDLADLGHDDPPPAKPAEKTTTIDLADLDGG